MLKRERNTQVAQDYVESIGAFATRLNDYDEPPLIIHDPQLLESMETCMCQIQYLIQHSKDNHSWLAAMSEPKLVELFVRLLVYSFEFITTAKTKGKHVFQFLEALIQLIWCLTNFSPQFRRLFHNLKGSEKLLTILSNIAFLDCVVQQQEEAKSMFMNALIGSLHNLSKSIQFEDGLNATQVLLTAAHKVRNEKGNLMQIYMILANVLTDKEIDELKDTVFIVNKLVEMVGACALAIAENTCSRFEIELERGRNEFICSFEQSGVKWDLAELIRALYRIAVNDRIKFYIYNDLNVKKYIHLIISHGNLVEKEYTISLLYQLSFDKNVARLIRNDLTLIESINNLIRQESGTASAELIDHCQGLLWIIKSSMNKNVRRATVCADTPLVRDRRGKQRQIMISYNSQNREMCLKIKQSLEQLGFKIWIDVENICGSSLEAMAQAIENSDCILICKLAFG